jgi:Bacterial virulence protein (VirJ)
MSLGSSNGFPQAVSILNLRGNTQTLHLYGSQGLPIILSSGDLGWAGLVTQVAEALSAKGYHVFGFDSRLYLSCFTSKNSTLSPQDVQHDFKSLVELVQRQSGFKPVLAGVSEGAALSVLAATDPGVKQGIMGVLALGLTNQNELGWRWRDFTIWLTKKIPNEPTFAVEDFIAQVSPIPLAEIHSTHDEFLSLEKAKDLLDHAREPKKMWSIESVNHRFSQNRAELNRIMLEALEWIQKSGNDSKSSTARAV